MLANLNHYRAVALSHYPEEMMRLVVPALGAPEHISAWCYNGNIPRRFRLIGYWGMTPDYSRVLKPYKNPTDRRIKALVAAGSEGTPIYEWWDDIQLVKNVSAEKTEHPCPLPLRLVSRILTLCANPGDLILDPFMGSGTTLVAARDLGMKAVGIEMDERYCEIAARRLQAR